MLSLSYSHSQLKIMICMSDLTWSLLNGKLLLFLLSIWWDTPNTLIWFVRPIPNIYQGVRTLIHRITSHCRKSCQFSSAPVSSFRQTPEKTNHWSRSHCAHAHYKQCSTLHFTHLLWFDIGNPSGERRRRLWRRVRVCWSRVIWDLCLFVWNLKLATLLLCSLDIDGQPMRILLLALMQSL
jgi:hypothetical protein